MASALEALGNVVRESLASVVDGIVAAIPRLVTALVFLTLAYVVIKVALRFLRSFLQGIYPEDEWLVAQLWVTVVAVFLWFGAALILLGVLGLSDLAASLGTATGFLALGVSYALSEMIEDAVAGVYLLRDPDFNPGDRVSTDDFAGTVTAIELRKTRFELESGDTTVVANRDVEPRWTLEATGTGD